MKLNKTILATLLSCLIIPTTQATAIKCPTTQSIASAGIDNVFKNEDGTWSGFKFNTYYDTSDLWSLGFYEFDAPNADAAMVKANSELQKGFYVGGPVNLGKSTICIYKTDIAYAVTFNSSNKISLSEIKKAINTFKK